MDKQLKQLIRVVRRTSLNTKNKAETRLLAKKASKSLIWLSKQPQSVQDEQFNKLFERIKK